MNRFIPTLLAVTVLASVGAITAQAGDEEHLVTICHVAGLASDPANYITLTIDEHAVYGPGGHFNENGTPQAGHEQDTFGECNPPPPVDVCPNLEGDQATLPDGYHFAEDENGRTICIPDDNPPPPPTDACPNLQGDQGSVPDGFELVDGQCVLIPPPPPPPPHIVVGAAGVYCDTGSRLYRTVGTIDNNEADSVTPATIPGNVKGVTNVVVTRGDTSYFTQVTTQGDCNPTVPTVVVTVAAVATPVVTPPPAAKPVVKPKPPVRKPAAKPKPKAKHKAPKPAPPKHKTPQAPPHTLGL